MLSLIQVKKAGIHPGLLNNEVVITGAQCEANCVEV